MDTQKLGFMLGQMVIKARDKQLPDISKIVGKVDGNTSKEYLALLMWTATWVVSRTLGQYAEQTLDAMHAFLYYAETIDKTKFETFIHDRYAGYYVAIDDRIDKGEDMGLYHVAKYFLSCCRSSGSPLIYKRLVPDWKAMEEATEAGIVRPDFLPKLRSEIEEDVIKMAQAMEESFSKIKNMPYGKALDEFASRVIARLRGTRLDPTEPMGHQDAGCKMLHAMADTLLKFQNNSARFQEELMAAARAWAEPPTYPMDIEKATQIISHFAGFVNVVASLGSDFAKKL